MPDAVWSSQYDYDMPNGYLNCLTCGAGVPRSNRVQHENFHKTFSNLRGENMSRVSWCDYGDHPFKAGEDGSASFEGTEFKDGVPVNTMMDACKTHNPLNAAREAARYSLTPKAYEELNSEN